MHVGGATKKKDQAAVQDEKAYLHEKEALNIESGQKGSSDGDRSLKIKSEDDSNVPTSIARPRWTLRRFYILLLLFVIAFSVGQKTKEEITKAAPESSSEKTDAEGQLDQPPQTSWWGKLVLPPRVQGLLTAAIVRLAMLAVVVFHLLRWLLLLTLFIMLQCFFHEEINYGVRSLIYRE